LAVVMALVGDVIAILIGPRMIHYWFEPPVASGAASTFNCVGALDYGISKLITLQLGATAAGAVLGIIFAALLWKRGRGKIEPTAPASSAPAR
jgi:hypothetical protein